MAAAVLREFPPGTDALTLLRAARNLLAVDGADAAAAGRVMVHLAIERLEADAAMMTDAVGELLDATHAHCRAGVREFIRAGDRKKYAVTKHPESPATRGRGIAPANVAAPGVGREENSTLCGPGKVSETRPGCLPSREGEVG
jgi:hypothetical protein